MPIISGCGTVRMIYTEGYMQRGDGRTVKIRRDDWARGSIFGQEDVYHAQGKGEFSSFWFRTFRFVRIEVSAGLGGLTFQMPYFLETGYPLDIKAQISASSPWVAPLWEISIRTLQLCMHETHEDCPYYEQLQYTMDTRLQMLFTYAIANDTRMARRVLWDYHSSRLPDGILQSRYPSSYPQVIPAFSLYFIFMVEEYYQQTGDVEIVRFYRPTIDGVLDYFDRKIGSSNLVEGLGYWDFCDWVPAWDKNAGVPDAVVAGKPSAAHNLCYALALQVASRLMELTGRDGVAVEYDMRADDIIQMVRGLCLNKEMGLLRDGPDFDQYSQHAQLMGVLTGLFTAEEAPAVLTKTISQGLLPVSFPWMFTLFRAMEHGGVYEKTASLWAPFLMALEEGLTTLPEILPQNTRSDCHAWSALLLHELPRTWLGVRPLHPGWDGILIAPLPCGQEWVEGTLPTPKGDVHVCVTQTNGMLSVVAQTPAGTPVTLVLPNQEPIAFEEGGLVQGEGTL